MARVRNPFTATLGADPPLLVGRAEIIEEFTDALDDGPGSHERVSLLVGPRGIGKTVVLNELEAQARKRGWIVISETATRGFVDKIIRRLVHERSRHMSNPLGPTTISLGSPWARIERAISYNADSPESSLREAFERAYAVLDEFGRFDDDQPGMMVTLDELHYNHEEEIIEFAVTIQHLIREGREIAVALAGIPNSIRPLLASKEGRSLITFLRRANRLDLGSVPDADVEQGLGIPVSQMGWRWEDDALARAVEASGGYPFMMQLIGYWSVRAVAGVGTTITDAIAADAVRKARKNSANLYTRRRWMTYPVRTNVS